MVQDWFTKKRTKWPNKLILPKINWVYGNTLLYIYKFLSESRKRMGQYFKIVNLTKRDYFSASIFDEGIKRSSILRGIHAYAFGKLLTIGLPEENLKWRKGNGSGIWAGCWAGDRIAIVGDETHGEFLGVEPLHPEIKPIILDDIIVLEFENIGGKLICWLTTDDDFAEWLLDRLQQNEPYMGDIGYIAHKFRHLSEDLIAFLDKHFPDSWQKRCKQIWEDRGNTFIKPDV